MLREGEPRATERVGSPTSKTMPSTAVCPRRSSVWGLQFVVRLSPRPRRANPDRHSRPRTRWSPPSRAVRSMTRVPCTWMTSSIVVWTGKVEGSNTRLRVVMFPLLLTLTLAYGHVAVLKTAVDVTRVALISRVKGSGVPLPSPLLLSLALCRADTAERCRAAGKLLGRRVGLRDGGA